MSDSTGAFSALDELMYQFFRLLMSSCILTYYAFSLPSYRLSAPSPRRLKDLGARRCETGPVQAPPLFTDLSFKHPDPHMPESSHAMQNVQYVKYKNTYAIYTGTP